MDCPPRRKPLACITAATVSPPERDGFATRLGWRFYWLADAAPEGYHSLAEAAKRVPLSKVRGLKTAMMRRRLPMTAV
jgi:hypothetical protein